MSYKNTKQSARRGEEKNSVCVFYFISPLRRRIDGRARARKFNDLEREFPSIQADLLDFYYAFSQNSTIRLRLLLNCSLTNCATFLLHLCIFQIKAEIFTLNRTATRNDFDTQIAKTKRRNFGIFLAQNRRENCELRKSLFSKSTLNPNSACDNWKRRKNFTFNFSFGASRQYFSE